jgi:hypothetical protein
VAARSRASNVFPRSNTGVLGSNPAQGMDVCLRSFCVCVALCSQRHCVGLIPRPGSPTDSLKIKKLKWNCVFHGCPTLQVGVIGIDRFIQSLIKGSAGWAHMTFTVSEMYFEAFRRDTANEHSGNKLQLSAFVLLRKIARYVHSW